MQPHPYQEALFALLRRLQPQLPPENTFANPFLSIKGIVSAPVDKTFTI
jgi:hypothetical protein